MIPGTHSRSGFVSGMSRPRPQPLGVDPEIPATSQGVEENEYSLSVKNTFLEASVDFDPGSVEFLASLTCGMRTAPASLVRSNSQKLSFAVPVESVVDEDYLETVSALAKSRPSTCSGDTRWWPPTPTTPLKRIPISLMELMSDTATPKTKNFAYVQQVLAPEEVWPSETVPKADFEPDAHGTESSTGREKTRRSRPNPRRRRRQWLAAKTTALNVLDSA
eukprot:TRINITY_DN8985_c1_g1_i1.p1 TRINITY_DN8985_c1_g1~~TRINITY_DN8985_c1_g1_i1.p1  ORF type:complete len:220 (+),score=26.87 TRINITY_DN8985_c1_g1_i1:91-750(+)